jgi:PPOX class probable F420-dependent enzyme
VPQSTLPESHRDLLERPVFAHLATVRPDGAPQSSVMWFVWDGELIRMTHTRRRQKFRNLEDEPRVALSMHDPDDPYRFLEVRGEVAEIVPDPEARFYHELAGRYGEDDPKPSDIPNRVVVVIRPVSYVAVEGGHVVKR